MEATDMGPTPQKIATEVARDGLEIAEHPAADYVPDEIAERMVLAWFGYPFSRGLHPDDQRAMFPAMRQVAAVLADWFAQPHPIMTAPRETLAACPPALRQAYREAYDAGADNLAEDVLAVVETIKPGDHRLGHYDDVVVRADLIRHAEAAAGRLQDQITLVTIGNPLVEAAVGDVQQAFARIREDAAAKVPAQNAAAVGDGGMGATIENVAAGLVAAAAALREYRKSDELEVYRGSAPPSFAITNADPAVREMIQPVEKLVGRWRGIADSPAIRNTPAASCAAQCADELEAALLELVRADELNPFGVIARYGIGAAAIMEERRRQWALGNSLDADETMNAGCELQRAAACYLMPPEQRSELHPQPLWPWRPNAWKPGDRLRELAKAGALIAAEIDRIARRDGRTLESIAGPKAPQA